MKNQSIMKNQKFEYKLVKQNSNCVSILKRPGKNNETGDLYPATWKMKLEID